MKISLEEYVSLRWKFRFIGTHTLSAHQIHTRQPELCRNWFSIQQRMALPPLVDRNCAGNCSPCRQEVARQKIRSSEWHLGPNLSCSSLLLQFQIKFNVALKSTDCAFGRLDRRPAGSRRRQVFRFYSTLWGPGPGHCTLRQSWQVPASAQLRVCSDILD